MSAAALFRQAEKTLARLRPEQRAAVHGLCLEIRAAERRLSLRAAEPLYRCTAGCRGLCCRNLQLDRILTTLDFVYLLTLDPGLREPIARCLSREDPFFGGDCVFLRDGTGPCIFPDDLRPQKCIVTFCGDDAGIRKEIRDVRRRFFHLGWFFFRNFLQRVFGRPHSP